jgi:hypothetical protein
MSEENPRVLAALLNLEPTGGTRTAGLLLTKEVLGDHFPTGAPLRSNAEVIANNRCLAALPRKSIGRRRAVVA